MKSEPSTIQLTVDAHFKHITQESTLTFINSVTQSTGLYFSVTSCTVLYMWTFNSHAVDNPLKGLLSPNGDSTVVSGSIMIRLGSGNEGITWRDVRQKEANVRNNVIKGWCGRSYLNLTANFACEIYFMYWSNTELNPTYGECSSHYVQQRT